MWSLLRTERISEFPATVVVKKTDFLEKEVLEAWENSMSK